MKKAENDIAQDIVPKVSQVQADTGSDNTDPIDDLPKVQSPAPSKAEKPSHWTARGPRKKSPEEYSQSPAAVLQREARAKRAMRGAGQEQQPPEPAPRWADEIPSDTVGAGQLAASIYCGFLTSYSRGAYVVSEDQQSKLADVIARWLHVRARGIDRFLPEILLAGAIYHVTGPVFNIRKKVNPDAIPHPDHGTDPIRKNDAGPAIG